MCTGSAVEPAGASPGSGRSRRCHGPDLSLPEGKGKTSPAHRHPKARQGYTSIKVMGKSGNIKPGRLHQHQGGGSGSQLFAGFLEALGVLGDLELVYALLDVAVHEHRKVVHRPVYAVVGDTPLGIIVGTDLS